MGSVYRAADSRLGREVAIKSQPKAFAGDPDRLARFEREARVLASLNHAHIATLHGVEHDGGLPLLVMELVPGETLAERIARDLNLWAVAVEPGATFRAGAARALFKVDRAATGGGANKYDVTRDG